MALQAFAPPMDSFRRGRDFAAWLGLVPRQHTTGGKPRLGKISRMGQRDLRRLLITGAMTVVRHAARRGETADPWLARMLARKPRMLVAVELARCEWIERRENVIALGPSGTGKTHVALGLGLAACQRGLSTGFTTAAAPVHELMEARDERRLLRLQKQMVSCKLLIIDELGFVPLRHRLRAGWTAP